MKQKIIPILVILAGFFLLSYPFVSNYLFEKSVGSIVESYQEKAAGMDQAIIKKVMDEAKQYNGELLQSSIQLTDPFKVKRLDGEMVHYNRILNIDGSSIMGYLKIPCISINLPIYHGTSGTVLEHGIGHLAASSFPIGGKDTHAVLTGHTGLSSAKIFTDLTEMKKGDFFFIHVLDKKLAYRVDQITVVEPQDTKELQIMEGKDHVTLVTCTPYGVNDKRLLVRGVRTAYHAKEEEIRARNHHSQWMEVYKRAIFAGLLIICVLIAARKVYEKITLLLYPEIISYLKQKQSDQTVKELTQRRSKRKQDDLLYQKAVRYNRKIFKEKQAGLKDVFSYRSAPIVLRNEKNTFGYIKIPKMKQKLPLYLGATMENMRKGAAIMGQTSLPVGQKDSNCVIAAHRGYRGIPYFRDIEQLKTGDKVIIRNPWERLDYRVTKIKVIDPYDMDKILIQKGKDMVTLLTCHPYRGHGRYRYVVYCMRNHGQKIRKQK